MASRSAGTLITHNNATYILPALMPGYLGHTPTAYFRCGETYGNATQKSFQDFRSAVLNSSQNPYKEGQFPTLYSNDPSLVIANRARNRDRWMHTCNWSRYNEDFNRMGELKQFSKVAQKHRDYYADKTGTLQKMNYFVLPGKEEDTFPCSPYTP
uniref:Ciliary microtubule inner protein 2C n=2 Tax=Latimeria chalumnae TaxID=7897 RepID=H3BEG8_LATCH